MTVKDTNPKTAFGIRKWRQFSFIPLMPIAEAGVVMMTGARKYGPFNWRHSGVRASVYFDAALGHLLQWWEGEEYDPESRLSHLAHAIASLAVLRDAQMHESYTDDRCHNRHEWAHFTDARADLQSAVDFIMRGWDEEQRSKEAATPKAESQGGYSAESQEGPFADPEAAWVTVHDSQDSRRGSSRPARQGGEDSPDKDGSYRP